MPHNVTCYPGLILGSASPRRLELLSRIGIAPGEVVAADIDESPKRREPPMAYVRRMALEKLQHIQIRYPDNVIVTADSSIVAGRRILGKPSNKKEAHAMLALLSGRRHRSLTAVAVYDPFSRKSCSKIVATVVKFKRLSLQEIEAYIQTQEWQDRAGGYAIGQAADRFIEWLRGSPTSVMGLPLCETANLLDNPLKQLSLRQSTLRT